MLQQIIKIKKGFNKMAKVKIGSKEFIIDNMDMDQIKTLLRNVDKLKLDNYDRTSFILSEVINVFNPEAKLTIKTFDKLVKIRDFEETQKSIMDISGLTKYFKVGVGKK